MPKPRLKKLRVLILLLSLALLALTSTVFGIMMAVSQDLPELENFAQYRTTDNTVVVDSTGVKVGTLTSNENKILVDSSQISANIKNAVVAMEDARFYEHRGVDFRGIGRALLQDVISRSLEQGGSTITQQFVKQATETQDERTPLQKLREAALAYHLERNWTKDRILTAYLNTIYFGQGAYGVEAAARTYFGSKHPECGTDAEPCASVLTPSEAALIAGIIQSPSAWDPKARPDAARSRRDTVLARMSEQGYISQEQYESSINEALPAPNSITPPALDSEAPYFTTWLRQQLVDRFGPARAFFGGFRVKSTLDMELQSVTEEVVDTQLGAIGPTAAVVVIDNETGGVKAMVGGDDYEERQFNLATQGYRQPGSSIKPFTLLTAMQQGISPESVWVSEPKEFPVPGSDTEVFPVANYEDSYLGSTSLRSATTFSDNSVFAELGMQVGTREIAQTIRRMGYSDPISTNPAMTLGGLKQGVNPLDWTYAFSTLANDGRRVTGTLAEGARERGYGPLSYTRVVKERTGDTVIENEAESTQVIPEEIAAEAKEILHTVVTSGTGTLADLDNSSQWGKTGTTDDNGDAWYCGGIDLVTACVWVGYADSNTPMTTEYAGAPVDGGTLPALIWHDIVAAWLEILEAREEAEESDGEDEAGDEDGEIEPVDPEVTPPDPGGAEVDESPDSATPASAEGEEEAPTDEEPAVADAPAPAPEPSPAPAPAQSPAPRQGGDAGSPGPSADGGTRPSGGIPSG